MAKKGKKKQKYDVIRPKTRSTLESARKKGELVVKPALKERGKQGLLGIYQKVFASVVFGRLYAVLSVVVLAATTLLWSFLGTRLQDNNADQLVDPYLFQNHAVLHGAEFPGAHSFLLKWPLFWLIRLFGYSTHAYITVTVAVVFLTVGALVAILYRIERRPAVFGTLCLALASTLLLVPTMPYPGGLLPVNMAMLATRNLEYVLYIAALVFVIRSKNVKSKQFWVAAICLAVLIASDKLFLAFSAGAAAIMLFVYALRQRTQLVNAAARWLLVGLIGALGAAVIILTINLSHITHIVSGTDTSPYGLVRTGSDLVLAFLYGFLGLLTNFGANPAFDATVVKDIPHHLTDRLLSISGPAYVINLLLLAVGLFAAWKVVRASFRRPKRTDKKSDTAHILSLALISSSVIALGVFVVTNHYFAVDARYLTITVFALFITVAAYARQLTLRRNYTIIAGLIILGSIFLAVPATIHGFADDRSALTDVSERNALVVQALNHHPVKALVGDYWRVIPTRQIAKKPLNVIPLSDCDQIRSTLTSKAWQVDLQRSSFAYLLSLDHGLTDFPSCSLDHVVAAYGRPNSSILLSGTFAHPQEELLFYDHGIQPAFKQPGNQAQSLASIIPISPSQLPDTSCDGPTIMNIVAHQDDDLLFTSPDLIQDIKAGNCVRSVYVTAGDAGSDQFYWLSRQQGSEAAYSNMIGYDRGWVQRIVKLSGNSFVSVAMPRGNSKISLIFMNLPDGNLGGEGFVSSKYESLSKLESGKIHEMHTVDHQSSYTSGQLSDALLTLMETFQPTEVRTQATRNMSDIYPDHSDHLAVGRYAQGAYHRYLAVLSADAIPPTIRSYIGYPIHELEQNVFDPVLSEKEAAFFAYAKHDGGVCKTIQVCDETSVYGIYLARQYQQPDEQELPPAGL